MSKYGRGKKGFQTTVRFNRKFVEYMDFHAKNLGLSRNELIEYSVDFATTNLDRFQTALIRFKAASEKFDSAATEEEIISAFREIKEAMKI